MTNIDWKGKLTSRKFWAAICEFVTMLIIAFGGTQDTAVQVTAIIMGGAGVLAYILAEGLVDASNKTKLTNLLCAAYEDKPPEEDVEK